ncbi:hypothetical protein [Methanocaldococcus fervens]|uniref:Uncharacterized protein n=1 Tax=Methanocaldococcus fervens (strain DSM 4213 / JCM 15782 / AG86) TaxID=573064 RepID=C7P7S8_METFA|nr:hypothetical protein [Methanocaldococcus fervens]ACV24610.1 hypothetical protein Mefer_0792 [Methanocaldococcus fervens AG86]
MNIVILYVVVISLILNVILAIKVKMLHDELEEVREATILTKEEVDKLNERLRKLKLGG